MRPRINCNLALRLQHSNHSTVAEVLIRSSAWKAVQWRVWIYPGTLDHRAFSLEAAQNRTNMNFSLHK